MNSGVVAKGLRTGEFVLSVLGISLLCWALAAVVHARVYQARQGRAFSHLEEAGGGETRRLFSSGTLGAQAGRSRPLGRPRPGSRGVLVVPVRATGSRRPKRTPVVMIGLAALAVGFALADQLCEVELPETNRLRAASRIQRRASPRFSLRPCRARR